MLNIDPKLINEIQKTAVEESRLGIPLIIGRDIVHGYKRYCPSAGHGSLVRPQLVEKGTHMAATEAREQGITWTFAPMLDISRDARWGRIAESLGEDPYLTSELGVAMVRGFQGDNLSDNDAIAACVKHFVGYGASEGGQDYNSTNIPGAPIAQRLSASVPKNGRSRSRHANDLVQRQRRGSRLGQRFPPAHGIAR